MGNETFYGDGLKLRFIVTSINLEYRERERQRKRESRRKAREAQQEKEWQRARARKKNKQRRQILLEEQHENFVVAVRKWEMLAAFKVKMSGSEKIVNKNTYDISSIKRINV